VIGTEDFPIGSIDVPWKENNAALADLPRHHFRDIRFGYAREYFLMVAAPHAPSAWRVYQTALAKLTPRPKEAVAPRGESQIVADRPLLAIASATL
jgi:hypothetical protein